MNVNEAKEILLLFRPETVDAQDPRMAAALALAQRDPELVRWQAALTARQAALRAKFRQIPVPAGLKEQIISEHAASRRAPARRRTVLLTLATVALWLAVLAIYWHPRSRPTPENSLAVYQSRMVRVALGGYAMDLLTNTPAPVRAYLAEHHAPADFVLPAPLEHAALTGCAVRNWQGATVSLICFRTGKPLPPGTASDLWLFVVDRNSVTNAPGAAGPQLAKINRLFTATWTQGNRLYLLGLEGDEAEIKRYL